METAKTLGDNLGKTTAGIRNVNWGGCGVAALQLYLALRRAGKKPKIMSAGKWAHVMIVLDGCFLDATGVVAHDMTSAIRVCNYAFFTHNIRPVKLSELRKEAKAHWNGWSVMYNHSQNTALARAINHAVKLTFAQPENVS